MKNFKHYILFALLTMTASFATAQVNITATPPTAAAPLNVCGAPTHVTVTVNCGGAAANNAQLTIQLPTGVRYVAGSAIYTAGASGSIGENVADPSAPILSVANLATGGSFTIDYQITADCRRINQPANTTNFVYSSTAGTQTFTGGSSSNPSYNVQYAAMNITQVTNSAFTGIAGGTFTRTIKIFNGGFGATPEIKLDEANTGGLQVQSVSVSGASSIVSSTLLPAGTTTYTIAGFTGNGYFDNNEYVIVSETLRMPTTGCGGTSGSGATSYKAYYGCFGDNVCPPNNNTDISSQAAAAVSWSGAVAGGGANLVISAPIASPPACFEDDIFYTMTVTNNGSADATNTVLHIDSRDANAQYLYGFEIGGNTINPTVTIAPSLLPTGCFDNAPAGALNQGDITLPTIAAGAAVTITFKGTRCCNSTYCRANATPYYGFKASATYADVCSGNKSLINNYYGIPSDPDKSILTMNNQIKDLLVFLDSAKTQPFCVDMDITLPNGDATGYIEFSSRFAKGITYKNTNAITTAINSFAWPIAAGYPTFVDSTVVFRLNLADMPSGISISDRNKLSVCLPVTGSTLNGGNGTCGGLIHQDLDVNYLPSTTCPDCKIKLFCNGYKISQTIELICHKPCGGKYATKGYSVKRTSLGFADANNDNIPDATGSPDPANIRTHDIILGDTVQVKFGLNIRDTTAAAVLGWTNCFINMYFEESIADMNPANYATKVKVWDAPNAQYINIASLTPTISNEVNSRRFIYNISAALPTGFKFYNHDSLFFESNYVAMAQGVQALVKVRPSLIITNDNTSTGNGGDCFGDPDYLLIRPIKTTVKAETKRTPNACATDGYIDASVTTEIQNDFGSNLYDFEVRKTAFETTWTTTLPTGVTFDHAEVKFQGDRESITTAWLPITPTSTAGGTVSFNLKPFYQAFGGSVPSWEDRSKVLMHIYYSGSNPVCVNAASNQTLTTNREFLNPIKAIKPTETTVTNFAFNNTASGSTNFYLISNDDLTSVSDTVTWLLKVANTSAGTLSNVWLAKKQGISGVTIANVRLLNCATGVPTGAALALNAQGYYELGNVTGSGVCLAIKATFQSCIKDSVTLLSGYSCQGYPADITNANILCGVTEQKLYVRPVPTQMQQIITAEPSAAVNLCDEFSYTLAVVSSQKGNIHDIVNRFVLLPGQGASVVNGSSQVEYPSGSGNWISISNPSFANNTYSWDISNDAALASTIGAQGLFGIDSALVFKNRYNLRFRVTTVPCNFKSGVVFLFQSDSKKACNELIKATDQVTLPLNIIGAPTATNTYGVRLTTGDAQPCNDIPADFTFTAINQGGAGATTANEIIELIFYNGGNLLGNITNIHHAPTVAPVVETVAGGTIYRYTMPAGVAVGDSVVFSGQALLSSNLLCSIDRIRMDASTSTTFTATCSTNNALSCSLHTVTGSDADYIDVKRPILTMTNLTAYTHLNPPTGETVFAQVTVRNTGTLPIASSKPFTIAFYQDADLSGTVTTGDYFIGTKVVAVNIAVNATSIINYTQDVPAGKACPLLALIEQSGCYCTPAMRTTTNVPVQPTEIETTTCQNITTLPIGQAAVTGYTYQWTTTSPSGLTYLSATNIANPTFTKIGGYGEDFEYILYINRGNGSCLAQQHITVHLADYGTCPNYEGSIGNYAWLDDNGNGLQDEAPSRGLNGVRVELWTAGANGVVGGGDDQRLDFVNTQNDNAGNPGYYLFEHLNAGKYYIVFAVTPTGAIRLTTQTSVLNTNGDSDAAIASGITPIVTIDPFGIGTAKDNLTIDAGYEPAAQLGDYVWNDLDKDGFQDATEVGIANVRVTLYNATTSALVATKMTGTNGEYLFDGLDAGNYYVIFEKPLTYTASPQTANTLTGSDADIATGRTADITLNKGQMRLDIDAGFYLTPLPVKLLSFNATLVNCTINLDWKTASEQNNRKFVVMRSDDGATWTQLAEVAGNGSTQTEHSYSLKDTKPHRNNYYKLVQYDYDGTATDYKLARNIETTSCYDNTNEGVTQVFPNPNYDGRINFKFYTAFEDEVVTVQFLDVAGQVVATRHPKVLNGANIVTLDIQDLQAGAYFVRIIGNGWYSETQKFVRMK